MQTRFRALAGVWHRLLDHEHVGADLRRALVSCKLVPSLEELSGEPFFSPSVSVVNVERHAKKILTMDDVGSRFWYYVPTISIIQFSLLKISLTSTLYHHLLSPIS